MKNAGKACNNRLYRHIRTFEKIVKNYFVIYQKSKICTAHLFAACKAEIQPAFHRAQRCHAACAPAGDYPLPAAVCGVHRLGAGGVRRQAEQLLLQIPACTQGDAPQQGAACIFSSQLLRAQR